MLNPGNKSNSLLKLRIPTLVGLVFLVVAMMLGTFFFSQGTGVFAPRATPQTTPKNVRITNISDNSFTISFLTDEPTTAFVKYGTETNKLDSINVDDDRDQLSGSPTPYPLHHISLLGLQPGTKYYFAIGTDDGAMFDNNGTSFAVTTAQRNGAPASAKTIYGSVTTEAGSPADGALVYVKIPGAADMSSLVKKSNSWAIPLSNARTPDGSAYVTVEETAKLLIAVQGTKASDQMEYEVAVKDAQPVPELQFGQTPQAKSAASTTPGIATTASNSATNSLNNQVNATLINPPAATNSGSLSTALNEQEGVTTTNQVDTETTIDLENKEETQQVKTTQPEFIGKVAPNVEVSIEVNSETQIITSVRSDGKGVFNLDLAALNKNLEPGDHTVKYSYTDPTTSQLISEIISFKVYAAEETAFGTENPYPVRTASVSATPTVAVTLSPTASVSATLTPTTVATDSGRVSIPSTTSGVPVSGSVDLTMMLIVGGIFFIIAGGWSYWISLELTRKD